MPEEKHIPMTLSQNGIHLPNGRGIFVGNWDLRKFIVKACNSYTQDQETIKDLVEALEGMVSVMDAIERDEGIDSCQCLIPEITCNYCKAQAALIMEKGKFLNKKKI